MTYAKCYAIMFFSLSLKQHSKMSKISTKIMFLKIAQVV